MISVTIITYNEEENIKRILENLQNFADEIVLVDSGSTDSTLEIAKKYKAKIFTRKFDNFANQKNYALSKTTYDWVLSVDADEGIPMELQKEIKEAVKSNEYDAYLIKRRNFILGKELKYSRWSPDKHIWLWKKAFGKWVGDVHEEVVVDGKIGELKNSKLHFSHKTLGEFIQSNILYSKLLAEYLHKKGQKSSFFGMFKNAVLEFSVRYIYKRGFLDGWEGFVLSYSMAIYQLMVGIKLWELEQRK